MAKKRVKRKTKQILEDDEFLPPFLQWVSSHPLLNYTEEELESEDMPARKRNALIRDSTKFEKEFVCPDSRTRNMFMHYRGNSGNLEMMWRHITKLHTEAARDKESSRIEREEDEAIADLKKVFAAAIGSGV